MNELSKKDYVARIASATPLQLVIINYEIVLDYLSDAKKNLKNDKNLEFSLRRALNFLDELKASLNLSYDISVNLMALYNYISQELSYCMFDKKKFHIEESEKVIGELLNSWKEIQDKEEDKTTVMENVEQLYAGLTYNKSGQLSEYVEVDAKRGFKA